MMDFLLYYEHHAREIDGLLALKTELAKRGYTAEILHYVFGRRWLYHRFVRAKAAVVPFLYNDRAIAWLMGSGIPVNRVVNLQWEQLAAPSGEGMIPSQGEIRLKANHLCWGEAGARALRSDGVSDERLHVAGAVHLDFCTEQFRSYYKSKEELAEEFGLAIERRWLLFVSNLVFARPHGNITSFQETHGDFMEHSARTQKRILEWVRRYCGERPEIEFIYRPHPYEHLADEVSELEGELKNFHIIREGSAREWVLRSEVCFVHSSTTIAEIYASGKTCGVLRPELCPERHEVPVYADCQTISAYQDFVRYCDGGIDEFPVADSNFSEYYDHRRDAPAYGRTCDVLEEVLRQEPEEDAMGLLRHSEDPSAQDTIQWMDVQAFFSELMQHGETDLAGIFLRVMGYAPRSTYNYVMTYLRDWTKQSEITEKQRRLCEILGVPELPAEPWLERALAAHRRGEDWGGIDFAGYDAMDAALKQLSIGDDSNPKELFAVLRELFPLSEVELDKHGEQLLRPYGQQLASVTRKLLRCEEYPPVADRRQAMETFLAPLLQADRIIQYGAGIHGGAVKKAIERLKLPLYGVWDRRAEEVKRFGNVPVTLPFTDEPGDGLLIVISLGNNVDYYPVREELLRRGYSVMDGAIVNACVVTEEMLDAR